MGVRGGKASSLARWSPGRSRGGPNVNADLANGVRPATRRRHGGLFERRATSERAMASDEPEPFLLPLSLAQVEQMVGEIASRRPGTGLLRVLLALAGSGEHLDIHDLTRDERYHAKNISRSVISSLLVLIAFAEGGEHKVTDLASELGMTTTTTMRYLKTWTAVGVLEQEQRTRRYRLAVRWTQGPGEPSIPHGARPGRGE
jgi:hypothetical protein